jgi:hypothetical protein
MKFTNRQYYAGVVVFLLLCGVAMILILRVSDTGTHDQGRLNLSGATAILHGQTFPIVQRPPLYSLFLASLSILQNKDTSQVSAWGREFGNINRVDAADSLFDESFLRFILIAQVGLWMITVLFSALLLRTVKLEWKWIVLVLLISIIPSFWEQTGIVIEHIFARLLLCIGSMLFVYSMYRNLDLFSLFGSGFFLCLAALARAVYQFLPIVILLILALPIVKFYGVRKLLYFVLAIFIPWGILIGGWSFYNLQEHGIFALSGVTGSALSSKTGAFIDGNEKAYPDETPIFTQMRDDEFLESPTKSYGAWGERASRWLMENRNMTYVEANQFLLKYNLTAIASNPLQYGLDVAQNLVEFHWTGVGNMWPTLVRILFSLLEFSVIILFLIGMFVWLCLRILPYVSPKIAKTSWLPYDTVILFLLVIYWYTAILSVAIDPGKSLHRVPVQFIIPLILVLTWHYITARPESIEGQPN